MTLCVEHENNNIYLLIHPLNISINSSIYLTIYLSTLAYLNRSIYLFIYLSIWRPECVYSIVWVEQRKVGGGQDSHTLGLHVTKKQGRGDMDIWGCLKRRRGHLYYLPLPSLAYSAQRRSFWSTLCDISWWSFESLSDASCRALGEWKVTQHFHCEVSEWKWCHNRHIFR